MYTIERIYSFHQIVDSIRTISKVCALFCRFVVVAAAALCSIPFHSISCVCVSVNPISVTTIHFNVFICPSIAFKLWHRNYLSMYLLYYISIEIYTHLIANSCKQCSNIVSIWINQNKQYLSSDKYNPIHSIDRKHFSQSIEIQTNRIFIVKFKLVCVSLNRSCDSSAYLDSGSVTYTFRKQNLCFGIRSNAIIVVSNAHSPELSMFPKIQMFPSIFDL